MNSVVLMPAPETQDNMSADCATQVVSRRTGRSSS